MSLRRKLEIDPLKRSNPFEGYEDLLGHQQVIGVALHGWSAGSDGLRSNWRYPPLGPFIEFNRFPRADANYRIRAGINRAVAL